MQLVNIKFAGINLMKNLTTIRKQKGLSLRKLSSLSGVAWQVIHRIEQGKVSPTIRTLEKLADALGCTVRDLI